MNIEAAIIELEALPLLGAQKRYAQELADRIALQIDPDANPSFALRLMIRRFEASPLTADSIAQLATAEAWASAEGEHHIATRLQLLWCRYVGLTDPEAVPMEVLSEAVAHAQKSGGLDAEWRLAMAAVHPNRNIELREEALSHLSQVSDIHHQLQVHMELATDRMHGADSDGAFAELSAALHIAEKQQDPEALGVCATRIGLHHLQRGRTTEARPHLEHALTLAQDSADDLNIVMLATLLSAIYLQANEPKATANMADLLLISGARRGNWFAVVDGHITHSSLSLLFGNNAEAVERLVRACLRLRSLVPAAAINLLKGRLSEIRSTLGAEEFDRHHEAALRAHTKE